MGFQEEVLSKSEISQLPRWAQVAFAARCARRVQPLFKHFWPAAPEQDIQAFERAIEVAEQSAAAAASSAAAAATAAAAVRAIYSADDKATVAAVVATTTAAVAVAVGDAVATTVVAAVGDAVAAAATCTYRYADSVRVNSIIRRDFDLLLTLSRRDRWTDSTPVPPTVFGPLWPEGPPPGWPSESGSELAHAGQAPSPSTDSKAAMQEEAETDIRLVLTATVKGDIPTETIAEDLLELYRAINDYHIARGGAGLKLEDFRRLVRSVVGTEV